jgi:uncharacterized protein YukE
VAERYVDGVLSGAIPACKWVKLACQRHRRDLKADNAVDWPYRFDAATHRAPIRPTTKPRISTMANLASRKRNSTAYTSGVWKRPDPDMDLEILTLGMGDEYLDMQAAKQRKAAKGFGGDTEKLPAAMKRKINIECLIACCLRDVKFNDDDGNPVSFAEFCEFLRDPEWAGALDSGFNTWLATSADRASTFEGYVQQIAGGLRYGANQRVMAAWDALSAAQQADAAREAGYQGGVDGGLNAWAALGHASALESAILAKAHAAGVPGFAAGTLATPPGAVWVGEQGPELLWQGGGAAVASSADSMRIANAYATAANDRYPANVTPIRPTAGPVVSDNREIAALLRDIARRIARLEEAIHEAEGEAQVQRDRIARDEVKLMRQQLDELQERQKRTA